MDFITVHEYSPYKGPEYQYKVTKEVIIPISSIVKIVSGDDFCSSSFSKGDQQEFDIRSTGSHIITSQTDEFDKKICLSVCESPIILATIINKSRESQVYQH